MIRGLPWFAALAMALAVMNGIQLTRPPAVCAGEATAVAMHEEVSPMLTFSVADAARLRAHWQASVYAQVWNSPSCEMWRGLIKVSFPSLEERWGLSPGVIYPNLLSGSMRIFPPRDDVAGAPVRVAIQLDCGAHSAQLFATLAAKGTPVAVVGADAAVELAQQKCTVARFGTTLVVSTTSLPVVRRPETASGHDLAIVFDARVLAHAFTLLNPYEPERAQAQALVAALGPGLASGAIQIDVAEQGLQTHWDYGATLPWLIPVERAWMGYLPNTVFCCAAVGIDGARLWRTFVHPLLDALSPASLNAGSTTQDANTAPAGPYEQAGDQTLKRNGVNQTLGELISGVSGTLFLAVSSGTPFPHVTVGAPASPAMDGLIAAVLKQMQVDLPAVGAHVAVSAPDIPVPIYVIRHAQAWVVTSDEQMMNSWSAPATAEWTSTALGNLVQAKLTPGTRSFSVTQTATALRTILGFLAPSLNTTELTRDQKKAILVSMQELISHAGMDYDVTTSNGSGLSGESSGLLGAGLPNALFADWLLGVGLPKLIASFTPRSDTAAMLLLTQVYPGEVEFHRQAYRSRTPDGKGEYGFFGELSGGPIAGRVDDLHLRLLGPRWQAATPTLSGYRFALYLPDGQGGALRADADRPRAAIAAGRRGPHDAFVAYAWPTEPAAGRVVFALTQDGQVYSAPVDPARPEPAWNDLFDKQGWEDAIVWQPYDRPPELP